MEPFSYGRSTNDCTGKSERCFELRRAIPADRSRARENFRGVSTRAPGVPISSSLP
jgi:hypothetical protein